MMGRGRARRVEAELRRSEAELKGITDAAPLLISYIDADQRYRFVNRTYEARFNQPCDAILGRTVREVLGSTGYDGARQHLELALGGERVSFESRVA